MLAAWEHLSGAEIAARFGLAESTVYVQLARGVKPCARTCANGGRREEREGYNGGGDG